MVTYPLGQLAPLAVKQQLIRWYFGSEPEEFVMRASTKLLTFRTLHDHLRLAQIKFENINEADHDIIEEHIDKLMIYYGTCDRWCPVSYYEDMSKLYPHADIRLCQNKIPHAFVTADSNLMAEIVWQWLCDRLPLLGEKEEIGDYLPEINELNISPIQS